MKYIFARIGVYACQGYLAVHASISAMLLRSSLTHREPRASTLGLLCRLKSITEDVRRLMADFEITRVGGIDLIHVRDESVGETDEVTIDDLDMSRDDTIRFKRRTWRRQGIEMCPLYKRYKDTRVVARKKGVDFPLTLGEFEDILHTTPVVRDDGALVPFSSIIEKKDRSTVISPCEGKLQLYYKKALVTSIDYSIV